MRPSWGALVVTLLACVLGIMSPTRSANSFSFTTIDVPGAIHTSAHGINGAGQMVGDFQDAGKRIHGFLRTATGTFTTIDVPGATDTSAHGINGAGQIVGDFQDAGKRRHGFLRTATGAYTTIDPPRTIWTLAYGINDAGEVVGIFDPDSGKHGFLRTATGAFATFDVPGATGETRPIGINGTGQIVGQYFAFKGVSFHGFVRTATGTFIGIDVPGATDTTASGINGAGQIVGHFQDAGKSTHGFLRIPTGGPGSVSGRFTTVDVPAAISTSAYGINDAGQIVGEFYDASHEHHGFVTTR